MGCPAPRSHSVQLPTETWRAEKLLDARQKLERSLGSEVESLWRLLQSVMTYGLANADRTSHFFLSFDVPTRAGQAADPDFLTVAQEYMVKLLDPDVLEKYAELLRTAGEVHSATANPLREYLNAAWLHFLCPEPSLIVSHVWNSYIHQTGRAPTAPSRGWALLRRAPKTLYVGCVPHTFGIVRSRFEAPKTPDEPSSPPSRGLEQGSIRMAIPPSPPRTPPPLQAKVTVAGKNDICVWEKSGRAIFGTQNQGGLSAVGLGGGEGTDVPGTGVCPGQ